MTDQLREALAKWGPFDPAFPIEDGLNHLQRIEIAKAARLVADGKVIPIEDTEQIELCVKHFATARSGWKSCFWHRLAGYTTPDEICEWKSARLWLGGTDESA